MADKKVVFEIDTPQFTVRLYQSTLRIDLKGSVKNEIEEALENKPVLRATLGHLLSVFAPLHVHLSDIDSVKIEEDVRLSYTDPVKVEKTAVRIHLPRHRDIIVPLEKKEAQKLVQMLNKLIPEEKDRELERVMEDRKVRRIAGEERQLAEEKEVTPLTGSAAFPIPEPSGVQEKEKQAEKKIIEEEEEEKER
jgi:hypothetical protein